MIAALGADDLTTSTIRGLHFGGAIAAGEPTGNELVAAEIIAWLGKRQELTPPDAEPVLERWTIDPGVGTVKREILDDRPQEFPRHDERRTGLPHRYGYATAFTAQPDGEVAILKHDLLRGSVQSRPIGPGSGPAEPVFVPRTPESAEDDGWLLCLSCDRDRDASDLLILTAADITAEPEAVVYLPVRVPAGFHGSWVTDTPGGD